MVLVNGFGLVTVSTFITQIGVNPIRTLAAQKELLPTVSFWVVVMVLADKLGLMQLVMSPMTIRKITFAKKQEVLHNVIQNNSYQYRESEAKPTQKIINTSMIN